MDGLAAHCAAAAPSWGAYDEDIKRDLGATAVALWSGVPIAVSLDAATVRVTFHVEGAWSSYSCNMPILLRDPRERLLRSKEVLGGGTERVYVFDSTDSGDSRWPWISLRYPMREDRLLLSQDGRWTRPQ